MKAGRLSNARVYSVEYFGHKNHFDQNGKLGMYRAVHVCTRDGYSGIIVKFAAMPMKNTHNNTKKNL